MPTSTEPVRVVEERRFDPPRAVEVEHHGRWWHGFSFPRAQAKASGIFDVALRVFRLADDEGISPAVAADHLAEQRMTSVGRLATIRLPR